MIGSEVMNIDNQICESLNKENHKLKNENNELSSINKKLQNEIDELKRAAKFTRLATKYMSTLRIQDFYDVDDFGDNIICESNIEELLVDFQKYVYDNSLSIEKRS